MTDALEWLHTKPSGPPTGAQQEERDALDWLHTPPGKYPAETETRFTTWLNREFVGERLPPPRPEQSDADLRRMIHETAEPKGFVGTTVGKTLPGLLAREITTAVYGTGMESPPGDFGYFGNLASDVGSFVIDPTMYFGAGVGGAVAKGVASKYATELAGHGAIAVAKRLAVRGISPAVTLGTITAVHDQAEQYIQNGDVDYLDTLRATAKSTILGLSLGPASAAGKLRIPAEIATFATVGPALEGEAPSVQSVQDATSFILAFALVNKITRGAKRVLMRDHKQRVDAGQEDATPNAETFSEAGLPGLSRKERAAIIEVLKQERADAERIRELEERVPPPKLEQPEAQRKGGEGVQRPDEARAEARQREVPESPQPGQQPVHHERIGFAMTDHVEAVRKGYAATRDFLKRFATSGGDMPSEARLAEWRRDGLIAAYEYDARTALRDLDRAVKKPYGGWGKMTPEQVQAVNSVLGGADPGLIPEGLRTPVARMRQTVDSLSRRLIEVGAVDGELEAVIRGNEGVYLHRSYRVFDDPEWAKKVPPEVRNKFKAVLRSEYPELTDNQVEQRIEALLYEGKAAETPIALLARSKKGIKDLSILQRRRLDNCPELRELYGEHQDPRVNFARSVQKMAALVANHRFLAEVREAGLGKFLWEPDDPNIPPRAKVRIAAESDEVMSPLNGLYTFPEVKRAFEQARRPGELGPVMRAYMKVLTASKMAKTSLSWMTHTRNLISGLGMLTANGHWRVWHAPKAFRAIFADLGIGDTDKWRGRVRRYRELGIVGESARANELRDMLTDALQRGPEEFWDRAAERGVRKAAATTMRATTKVYGAEDDIRKIFAFEDDMQRYGAAFPEMPRDQLERYVADIVRNTDPTYSLVPEGVKLVRRAPLIGPFVSFWAEIYRTGKNSLTQCAKDLSDPRTRQIGVERATGILLAASVPGALAAWSRHLMGMTRDDVGDMRLFLPTWSENSDLVIVDRPSPGIIDYIDLSYTDPYQYLKKPIMALLRNEDWDAALLDSLREAVGPLIAEELVTERLLDIARNQTADGRPVYNTQDPVAKQANDIALHLGESLEPGTLTSLRRILKGLGDKVDPSGKSYDATIETVAMLTGHRLTRLDVRQALYYRALEYRRDIAAIRKGLHQTAANRGAVADDEIRAAYTSMDERARERFAKMHSMAEGAIRLGVPSEEIVPLLETAGFSQKEALLVLTGQYTPYSPGGRYLHSAIQKSGAVPAKGAASPADFQHRRMLINQMAMEASNGR